VKPCGTWEWIRAIGTGERCGLGAHGGGAFPALAMPARLRVVRRRRLEDARRCYESLGTMRLDGNGDVRGPADRTIETSSYNRWNQPRR